MRRRFSKAFFFKAPMQFFILLAAIFKASFAMPVQEIDQLLEIVETILNQGIINPILNNIRGNLISIKDNVICIENEKYEADQLKAELDASAARTNQLKDECDQLRDYFQANDVQRKIDDLREHQQDIDNLKAQVAIAETQLNVLKDNKKSELQILHIRKNEKEAELSKVDSNLSMAQEQKNSLIKTVNSLDVKDNELKDKMKNKDMLLERALEKNNLLIEAIQARSEHTRLSDELEVANVKLRTKQSDNEELRKVLEGMKKGSVQFQDKKVVYDEFIVTVQVLDSIKDMILKIEQLEKELEQKQKEKEQRGQQLEELKRLSEEKTLLQATQARELEIATSEAKELDNVQELGEKELSKSVKEAISAKEESVRNESMQEKFNGLKRGFLRAKTYAMLVFTMISTTFIAVYRSTVG